jgi:hypothetical protein
LKIAIWKVPSGRKLSGARKLEALGSEWRAMADANNCSAKKKTANKSKTRTLTIKNLKVHNFFLSRRAFWLWEPSFYLTVHHGIAILVA